MNAIKVHKEYLVPNGYRLKGIRLDSGDLAYLSKECRKILDENDMQDCAICVSNSLDEYLIKDLYDQGAKIDSFGVGENLITSKSTPVFGGVYKLSALEKDGKMIPKIKVSENVEKITNPGFKSLYRLYDKETDRALADVITLENEPIPEGDGYEIFDPSAVWKRKMLNNFYAKDLRVPIFVNGECVYESPSIEEIRAYCKSELDSLWDEIKRFDNPQTYYVDLSHDLWKLKNDMLAEARK
jgi:nicotinate phosphoribosyltransferase